MRKPLQRLTSAVDEDVRELNWGDASLTAMLGGLILLAGLLVGYLIDGIGAVGQVVVWAYAAIWAALTAFHFYRIAGAIRQQARDERFVREYMKKYDD